MKRPLRLLFLLAAFAPNVLAHEVRPAYLELRQTGLETFDALWKVPGQGENLRLGLYVEFPAGCTNVTSPRVSMVNNAFSERWTVRRTGGLAGGTIHIAGLSGTEVDVLVRLERLDGSTQVTRLTSSAPSFVVEAAPRALEVARTYSVLGIEHILTGIDHLLFVLALLIIVRGASGQGRVARGEWPAAGGKGEAAWGKFFHSPLVTRHWPLIKTVTAFTLSHSITLTLATLGYVHIPQRPVEATIALSIVFVAAEIVRGRGGRTGITAHAPSIVAFAFGLMHGLGFASGLSEAGLPVAHIPTALFFFSIGVETGHFLFIGVVLSLMGVWQVAMHRWSVASHSPLATCHWPELLPPYAIGTVAMFWVIQRIAAF